MKNIKAVLCVLLCAALVFSVLTSCGQTSEQTGGASNEAPIDDKTYGRYVEQDITPDGMTGGISNFVSFGGGILDVMTVDFADNGRQSHWRSEDNGETWQELDISWFANHSSPDVDNDAYMITMQPTSSGAILANISWMAFENGEQIDATHQLVFVDENGVETPI